jgi:broad specificity phosphatase PhoE
MEMMSTFASWAIGDIDNRLAGGESGRDVLERGVEALKVLSQTAVSLSTNTEAPSVLAVSHSTYLRVLLSMVNDSPLSQSAFWKINNGSINVVDVNVKGKTRMINLNSNLFGGGRALGVIPRGSSESIDIMMPESYLIRRNEIRHLDGMEV